MSGQKCHEFESRLTISGHRIRLTNALRKRWTHKTAEHVAAVARVPVPTARKWLSGEAFPSGLAILFLVDALGVRFIAEVLGAGSVEIAVAARNERRAALLRDLADLDRV